MDKKVRKAFKKLQDEVLVATASDFTSDKDANIYTQLSNILSAVEESFDKLIRKNNI